MKSKWIAAILFATVMVMGAQAAKAGVNDYIAAACKDGSINADKIIAFWTTRRVIRDVVAGAGLATVYVSTERWAAVDDKVHISIAIAAYCSVADADGYGTAMVRGSLEEMLGSAVDGNYWR